MPSSGSAWRADPVASTTTGTGLALDEVDRTRWDVGLLRAGPRRTRPLAAAGDGRFAIEAAIAGLHSSAASFERTDWPRIVQLYGALEDRWPSPSVRVARLVATAHAILADAAAPLDAVEAELRALESRRRRHTPAVTRASPSPTSSGARDGESRRRRATATSPRSCAAEPLRRFCLRAVRHSPVTPSTASRRKSA